MLEGVFRGYYAIKGRYLRVMRVGADLYTRTIYSSLWPLQGLVWQHCAQVDSPR